MKFYVAFLSFLPEGQIWTMSLFCRLRAPSMSPGKFPVGHTVKAFPCRLFRTSYHTKICTKVKLWVPFCVGVGQSFKWLLKGDKNLFLLPGKIITIKSLSIKQKQDIFWRLWISLGLTSHACWLSISVFNFFKIKTLHVKKIEVWKSEATFHSHQMHR